MKSLLPLIVTDETLRETVEASNLPLPVVILTVTPFLIAYAEFEELSPWGRLTLCSKLLPPFAILV